MKLIHFYSEKFFRKSSNGYCSLISDQKQLKVCHNHDYYEIFVVEHGFCEHYVNHKKISISEGTLFFMRPNDIHYYDNCSKNFNILNIIIPQSIMESLFNYLGDTFFKVPLENPTLPPNVVLEKEDLQLLISNMKQLFFSTRLITDPSDTLFRITLFNIITRYFPVLPTKKRGSVPEWLQWLVIEMTKKENFSIGFSAMHRLSNKSIEHLSRSCKKYLKKTPTEIINDIRIEFIVRNLIITNDAIINLSEEAGFESLSYFYHLFKNRYGITPKEFRKKSQFVNINPKENFFVELL